MIFAFWVKTTYIASGNVDDVQEELRNMFATAKVWMK